MGFFGDKLALTGVIVSGFAILVSVALHYLPTEEKFENWLACNPAYRQRTIDQLKAARWTTLYRDTLTLALGWLAIGARPALPGRSASAP